jgi:hypothetical protein
MNCFIDLWTLRRSSIKIRNETVEIIHSEDHIDFDLLDLKSVFSSLVELSRTFISGWKMQFRPDFFGITGALESGYKLCYFFLGERLWHATIKEVLSPKF